MPPYISSNARKTLFRPPLHIANVLAHMRILLRELDRALAHTPDVDEELRLRLLDSKQSTMSKMEALAGEFDISQLY